MLAGWYLATAFSPGSAIPASIHYIMVYFSPKQSGKDKINLYAAVLMPSRRALAFQTEQQIWLTLRKMYAEPCMNFMKRLGVKVQFFFFTL
jgi:hypothetical protein